MITPTRVLRFGAPLGLAAVLVLPTSTTAAAESSPLLGLGFSSAGVAPDAAAEPTAKGREIKTLQAYSGRLYYGHGDYGDNTGSLSGRGTYVSHYDPSSGTFGAALTGNPTEEINTFRPIAGKLYAPAIDPSVGASAQSSYAAATPPWQVNTSGTPSVHLFDVATSNDSDLFLATGDSDGGGLWRSTDTGRSWQRTYLGADPTNDGYERFYWLGRIGNSVYTRFNHGYDNGTRTSPILKFDARRGWVKVKGTTEFGRWTTRGSDLQSVNGSLWTPYFSQVQSFDGSKTLTHNPGVGYVRAVTAGDDHQLYVLGTDGVARIDSRGRVTRVLSAGAGGLDAAGATAIAVHQGRLWIGTKDSELFNRAL